MQLINIATQKLEEFIGKRPPYAILSHVWADEEVTYQDLHGGTYEDMAGYQKILSFCRVAAADGVEYVWVDTCCIDKSSSSDLSESINSMYNWYREAHTCYIYLADVMPSLAHEQQMAQVAKSRWFTRGWTLQELIAQPRRKFFDQAWQEIKVWGTFMQQGPRLKTSEEFLSKVTNIPHRCLRNSDMIRHYSVAKRLSWAALRQTTRAEDMAYCLLGLFEVNMPLLYGEGGERAFIRLQKHIMEQSPDQSLLSWGYRAWRNGPESDIIWGRNGALAPTPSVFAYCDGIDDVNNVRTESSLFGFRVQSTVTHSTWTNQGILIRLPFMPIDGSKDTYLAALRCYDYDALSPRRGTVCIPLQSNIGTDNSFKRIHGSMPVLVSRMAVANWPTRQIYLSVADDNYRNFNDYGRLFLLSGAFAAAGDNWTFLGCHPPVRRVPVVKPYPRVGEALHEQAEPGLDIEWSTFEPLRMPQPYQMVWFAFSHKSVCLFCGVQATKNRMLVSRKRDRENTSSLSNVLQLVISPEFGRSLSEAELHRQYQFETIELREGRWGEFCLEVDGDLSTECWVLGVQFLAKRSDRKAWQKSPVIELHVSLRKAF